MTGLPVAIYGMSKDIYKEIREKSYEKKAKLPYGFIDGIDIPLGIIFNQMVGNCLKHSQPFFIIQNYSIKIKRDILSKIWKNRKQYKKLAFVVDSEDLYFCVFTANIVNKFGKYKRTDGSARTFFEWLKMKALSEGYEYGVLKQSETDMIQIIDADEIIDEMKENLEEKSEEDQNEFVADSEIEDLNEEEDVKDEPPEDFSREKY